jgi:hypothetical protein
MAIAAAPARERYKTNPIAFNSKGFPRKITIKRRENRRVG